MESNSPKYQTAEPPWHALSVAEIFRTLDSSRHGLAAADAAERLQRFGPNLFRKEPRWGVLRLFARQLWTPLSGVLLVAALLAFALRDAAEGWVIMGIVFINALFGFFLEHRANCALRELADVHPPRAAVLRGGSRCTVATRQIVPGDVVFLEAGDAVAADVRLLESFFFQCAEAILTGEAVPVLKDANASIPSDAPLAERITMAYAGTNVLSGRALGLVVATGMASEAGKIAHLLESAPQEHSPGLQEVAQLGRALLGAAAVLVPLLAAVCWARGEIGLSESLWIGVSLAVAALPEGLQTVLIAALAFAAHRLHLRDVVVRRLGALETLGCVDVVCTDKTGTLTEGRMSVAAILTARGDLMELRTDAGAPIDPSASERGTGQSMVTPAVPRQAFATITARRALAEALAGTCSGDAPLEEGGVLWSADPTEVALLAAAKIVLPEAAHGRTPFLGKIEQEIPFDAVRRRRTVLRRGAGGNATVYVAGAPEEVFRRCASEWTPEGTAVLDSGRLRWWSGENARLAAGGLRVVATAYRAFQQEVPRKGAMPYPTEEGIFEAHLILVGLVGMHDAVRAGAMMAVERAKALGVRLVMLTGDQLQTAAPLARRLGFEGVDHAVNGADIEEMSDDELAEMVARSGLYARVTPGHKLRIVEAWKKRGAVVGMIGDGINDAPALRAADVGIVMGGGGAHVTRQAGDLVLLNEQLGALMEALAQGRRVRASVGRSLEYLLTGNAGEVLLIGVGRVVTGTAVLTPLQLLWINLITDGLPALFLALPGPGGAACVSGSGEREPPVIAFTDRRFWLRVAVFGCCAAGCAAAAYARGSALGGAFLAKSYACGAVVFEQLLRSVTVGIKARGDLPRGVWGLRGLLATAVAAGGLQVLLLRNEAVARLFGGVSLVGEQIAETLLLGAFAVLGGHGVLAVLKRARPLLFLGSPRAAPDERRGGKGVS